jgi:hypothetical protein
MAWQEVHSLVEQLRVHGGPGRRVELRSFGKENVPVRSGKRS